MNVLFAVAGPLSAILGVLLGAVMSARIQERSWRQEQFRRSADVRRTTYVKYLAALRAYVTYMISHPEEISVRADAEGTDSSLLFTDGGYAFREALETSYAELQLMAMDQNTVNQAHLVARAARRIAVAAANRDDNIRSKLLMFWEMERGLVNQLRHELGQGLELAAAFDADADLP